MESLNEEKNYPKQEIEQKISSIEPEVEKLMPRKYITSAEKKIYRKLVILGTVVLITLMAFFFWGLPILARLAGILTFFQSNGGGKNGTDVIPPFPPRLEGVPIATNSATIKLTGFAESGTTLEIFLNGALAQKLLLGIDGKFEIENFNLSYGENKLQLKSIDKVGNASPITEQIVLFANTPPTLEISEPAGGTIFYGQSNLVKVAGKTDPNSTVLVNSFWAIVDQEGKFSLSYPAQIGENRLEIVTQDVAGNQTKKNLTIYYNP